MRHLSLSLAPVLEAFQLCEDFCNITVQILTFLRKSLKTTKGLGKKYSGIETVWSANTDFLVSFTYFLSSVEASIEQDSQSWKQV